MFSTFMVLVRSFSTSKYFASFIANSYFFAYISIFSGALAKIYFFDSPLINNILSRNYFFYSDLAIIKTLIIFFWAILVFFLITFYYNEYFEKKFGYELANPQPDTHEAEYEEANRNL
jgi:hypothetical protein